MNQKKIPQDAIQMVAHISIFGNCPNIKLDNSLSFIVYHFLCFFETRARRFLKIQRPARIPPQTPPPRGQNAKNKLVSVLRKSISPENSFRKNRVRIEAPPHCPNTWRAEPQKEKCPFHFRKKPPPRKSKEQGKFFFLGLPSEARRWRSEFPSKWDCAIFRISQKE